jgi:hypothetical protein
MARRSRGVDRNFLGHLLELRISHAQREREREDGELITGSRDFHHRSDDEK